MKVFILPVGTPAQVRSWNVDYQREVLKLETLTQKGSGPAALESQKNRALAIGAKVERYLNAVASKGGKIIQPPKTKVEQDIELTKRSTPLYQATKQDFRSNY